MWRKAARGRKTYKIQYIRIYGLYKNKNFGPMFYNSLVAQGQKSLLIVPLFPVLAAPSFSRSEGEDSPKKKGGGTSQLGSISLTKLHPIISRAVALKM